MVTNVNRVAPTLVLFQTPDKAFGTMSGTVAQVDDWMAQNGHGEVGLLVPPVMNFGEPVEEADDPDILPVPTMNFEPPTDGPQGANRRHRRQGGPKHPVSNDQPQAGNSAAEVLLLPPTMEF